MTDENDAIRNAYAIWLQVEEAELAEGAIGVDELMRLLSEPGFSLSPAQQAALFRTPRLRADLAALKRRRGFRPVLAAAAASGGDISERPIPGGTIRLTPSTTSSQVYVTVIFDEDAVPTSRFTVEFHRDDIEIIETWPFDAPDANGESFDILDPDISPKAAAFLALLRDPLSEGDLG